jgi:hypothetical protein
MFSNIETAGMGSLRKWADARSRGVIWVAL